MPGQIFASINSHSLGFIREYSENLYTVKISTYGKHKKVTDPKEEERNRRLTEVVNRSEKDLGVS